MQVASIWTNSAGDASGYWLRPAAVRAANKSGNSPGSRSALEPIPVFRALREEADLPCGVRGPVDCSEFRRRAVMNRLQK